MASIKEKPTTSLPNQAFTGLIDPDTVTRVALIGPAFAENNTDVSAYLKPILGPGVEVHLVVNTRHRAAELSSGHRAVHVPKRFLDGLRERVGKGNVHVYGAAIDDPDSPGPRTLHGKCIAIETKTSTWHLTGSANLTRRGLSGMNREVAVVHPGDPGDVDDVLATVRARRAQRIINVDPDDVELPATVDADSGPVFAVFVPDAGQNALRGYLRGELHVAGTALNATIYLADGRAIKLHGGTAKGLLLDMANPRITVGTSHRIVLLHIRPVDDDFWTSAPLDTDPVQEDPLLAQLRRDYTATSTTTVEGPAGHGSGQHDGFAVPLNRALNTVTRYADQIAAWPEEHVNELLQGYFADDPAESAVAHAVISAARSGVAPKSSTPLGLLKAAVVAHAGGK